MEKEEDKHMCFFLVQKTTTGKPVFKHIHPRPQHPSLYCSTAGDDLRFCVNITILLRHRPGQLEQIKEVLEDNEGQSSLLLGAGCFGGEWVNSAEINSY